MPRLAGLAKVGGAVRCLILQASVLALFTSACHNLTPNLLLKDALASIRPATLADTAAAAATPAMADDQFRPGAHGAAPPAVAVSASASASASASPTSESPAGGIYK
ncbi:hypothetical protein KEM52_004735 [Ascosphaera acerosa]|nr:hypothetical protein KEM52_004735 [Ascosphaera acerosa]